ncbi:MAG: histidine--tRNA ligase [candidate division Zixibacteria bacterium]
MAKEKIKAIYGTKDILPDDTGRWLKILSVVSQVAKTHNYGLIVNPIFEATELFARGIGETSDVVSKEMYTFSDQGGRSLTLRPEGTASVIRAYIEHSLGMGRGISKLWYAGPMFRQERPQAGRYRQFYQFGIEAIGSLEPSLDAELIGLNYEILRLLGIEDLTLEINSIGMPADRNAHREAFTKFAAPFLDNFCADCKRRFEINPLRMFDCKREKCQANLGEAPVVYEFLTDENLEHFKKVLEYLEILEIPFNVNKRLVRGLDYYTRTAWEFKSSRLGSQDSISGGGRYDLLSEQLGGPPTPGIGFAAGMERILMAMPDEVDVDMGEEMGFFLVISDEKFRPDAFKLSAFLRKLGLTADIDYQVRSMKAQMKQAGKSGFKYAVIFAEDEMKRGAIVLRNLADSSQFEIVLSDIYNIGNIEVFGEFIGKKR